MSSSMVYILLGDGFETAEALVPADLMRRAGIPVALAGVSGREVVSGQGVRVMADVTLDQVELDELEMLVLPGGKVGVEAIQSSMAATTLIQRAAEQGRWVAAICAAPTVLARLGLLDRRSAVCYPGMEEEMFSAVVKKRQYIVQDGRFITAEAAGSSFAFGLKLIEVLKGRETAEKVKDGVHYHY